MTILGGIFALAGSIGMLIFGIQILIRAFQESVLWGLAYLFVPFAGLVFIVMYWQDTKKPFLYSLACLPLLVIGGALVGMGSGEMSAAGM